MRVKSPAFTLTELLVVIAVIVLLVATLVPSLAKAREQSKNTVCQSSMRQIGQLIFAFASGHEGRGPGRCKNANAPWSPDLPYPEDQGAIEWADILNYDLLDVGNGTQLVYGVNEAQTVVGYTIGTQTLRCPNFIVQPNSYGSRAYGYNYDAAGGDYFGPQDGYSEFYGPSWGVFGKRVDPRSVNSARYTSYALGAKLAAFEPDQFLLIENERRIDWTYRDPPETGNGSVALSMGDAVNNDPTNPYNPPQPAWSACGGQFSFRHPYFKKANFLFFDGHVAMLTPADDICSARRLNLGKRQNITH